MFPKWFSKWNSEHPTNIYGPGILVGGVGGAVVVAALLVSWGQPFATDSLQTGPRGTGMSVPEFEADLATPDPAIEAVFENQPFLPQGDEPLARDIYENVQVLGDLTEDNFNRLMLAMTEWVAPDEGCAYCHGDVELEEYGSDDLYTKVVSRRMIEMTQNINENWDGHVNANKEVGVTCYTCHRGENVPSDIWFRLGPLTSATAGWSAVQNRVTVQSQSTSLPSDALESYLLEYERIGVHNLESRVSEDVTDPDVPTWQNTERTYSLMNYFSNSLGVNCVFCHNSRAFYDPAQVTPQWSTASLGIAMVQEMNNDYLVPLKDVYPEHRLGPVFADAPKAACKTCHKGYQQPLQGLNVIADWPELATTGAPDYAPATQ
ncbi:photosynthetic reaction center cytochrome PufC [Lutimaribacter sp. EGI FJ00015]|uniref:Photosynthetic reaction center cytochrome PufC n=1 Tax=Lutimaribacter degradans TaxID=2945989 RepID=A0ACC5ZV32_9RHOB|nr:photosynthetic reaction center cytochrome PufC [Lutimaribacter sp. EGI FJ00013]MCM2562045.1 photosynthetic reaction center cytochrome PufC [Lutimaribacter sp. EGI FJ00013]MCO0612923.1 photosynthetic reaction center cytochrome PufC [Lutimaribacter sp. EGI FJ00015]MCO0635877.1 photosynthetic reaction center cytochrome PufC [Lutimaribacter sp. EGI FJ00014]